MLSLKNVKKDYVTGNTKVHALKGISVDFRDNEFVSVLGPSGCGKTTLLNIVGGLDKYTEGDLIINGKSTKTYRDADWDAYRNHTIGFVFQTYNLIMHQTVLGNVELALTLSGVSPKERKERATAALAKVGLTEQLNKKPNQLSGGQMQRVAIARAIVNNPDVILADEPTGALDTATSVQIMDILKEIAKDRLVVMVTHNPDLAERYSTRIIRLSDGLIVSDTNPVSESETAELYSKSTGAQSETAALSNQPAGDEICAEKPSGKMADKTKKPPKSHKNGQKRPSMSFKTALLLSLKNLLTKKARTILVSFAGSIGIIGIALILSLSSGFQLYINRVQQDTLSTYPLTIEREAVDMSAMVQALMGVAGGSGEEQLADKIYSNDLLSGMLSAMSNSQSSNNLPDFKKALESAAENELKESINAIKFTYDMELQIYTENGLYGGEKRTVQVAPNPIFGGLSSSGGMGSAAMSGMGFSFDDWSEMLDNQELLESQYDLVGDSRWPAAKDEVVVAIDENNMINDYVLYALGLLDSKEVEDMQRAMLQSMYDPSVKIPEFKHSDPIDYEDILGLEFKLVFNPYLYNFDEEKKTASRKSTTELNNTIAEIGENGEQGLQIKVVGIVKPKQAAAATSISGTIGYTHALTEYVSSMINNTPLVRWQTTYPETNVFTGKPFDVTNGESYESNMSRLGCVDLDKPSTIGIYAVDFEAKDKITKWVENYNSKVEEEDMISYTDYVGLMMSSISTIINAISYVLIAFVAISLIVSSIMIGIITYISVLERTKEIGILRSIGASKRDISRVFNAETFIVGFAAGLFGVVIAALIDIPINIILVVLAGLGYGIAAVPWWGAFALILISVVLTLIAGLIPARFAAKRDPVIALRTE